MQFNSNSIVNSWGEEVTITSVTLSYDETNDWQEPSKTTTANTVKGIMQWITGDEEPVKSGVLEAGDLVAFFPTGTSISTGDTVTYQSDTFRVVGIQKQAISVGNAYLECHLKRKD